MAVQVDQSIFNIVMTVAGLLGGWVLNTIWTSVRDLQAETKALRKDDRELADRVAEIEVLVVGKYITKDDFNRSMDAISMKLDTISDRLSNKADRH